MLRQRIVTALVLLALLVGALVAPMVWPFALLTLLLVGAAGWEWARLNQTGAVPALLTGLSITLLGAALLWWTQGRFVVAGFVWWAAMALWVLGGVCVLRLGVTGWPRLARVWRWLLGVALLALAWLALTQARFVGINFLLSVFALVWAADIAAYFGGRAWGRRKLAPAISPGKSWEGVWSGMLGVLLVAVLWVTVERRFALDSASLYLQLLNRLGWAGLVLSLLFLSAMSVVGDLFESLVKRSAGAKDSSALLPGHGGVLDRVDALLPVFPLVLALSTL